jgi:hypothetical protein
VPNLLDLVADNIAIDGIVPLAGPFECDYVIGSMSLPWRCGVDMDQVNGKPYFKAEPAQHPAARQAECRPRLARQSRLWDGRASLDGVFRVLPAVRYD